MDGISEKHIVNKGYTGRQSDEAERLFNDIAMYLEMFKILFTNNINVSSFCEIVGLIAFVNPWSEYWK